MAQRSHSAALSHARRVLVLGAGFIGGHVACALAQQGHEVVVLTRRQPSGFAADLLDATEVIVGEAGVTGTLSDALDGVNHVVFALSSLLPGEADEKPALDVILTLGPLLALLDQLSRRPETSLTILSSGGTVYGRALVFPTPEDAPTNPMSSYGITKLMAEKYVLRHSALYSVPVRVARIANAYGPGQVSRRGQGVVAAALECCMTGNPLVVFGDGSVARDFVHVEDVSAAVARLVALGDGPAIVNIGSGTSTNLQDLVHLIRDMTGYPLKVQPSPGRAFDVPRVQLDIGRLRSMIPFNPRSLRVGIADTWSHFSLGLQTPVGVLAGSVPRNR